VCESERERKIERGCRERRKCRTEGYMLERQRREIGRKGREGERESA
jgi:hypothetical protein